MPEKVVILSPTELEISEFHAPPQVIVEVCGVGMAEAAAATHRAIVRHAPGLLVLAGIAGAYPDSGLSVGDVVAVASERIADLGAIRSEGRFEPLFEREYVCPHVARFADFRAVASNTVSSGATPYIAAPAAIENMEGAAFFAVCLAAGVRFLELRAVSNIVGDAREKWDTELAVKQLSYSLNEYFA